MKKYPMFIHVARDPSPKAWDEAAENRAGNRAVALRLKQP